MRNAQINASISKTAFNFSARNPFNNFDRDISIFIGKFRLCPDPGIAVLADPPPHLFMGPPSNRNVRYLDAKPPRYVTFRASVNNNYNRASGTLNRRPGHHAGTLIPS